jgi:hypothetical protein
MTRRAPTGELLFPVRNAPERYFYAGHLADGRQALIARSVYGRIIAALFDREGELVEVIRQELPSPPVLPDSDGFREVDEDDFHAYLKREFGFSPGLVHVKEFYIAPEGFAVYQLPWHFQEFLRDPGSLLFADEERGVFPRLIEEWQERGEFVLEWGNDFWLDGTGVVIAS